MVNPLLLHTQNTPTLSHIVAHGPLIIIIKKGRQWPSLEEHTSGEYIFLFRICEKNYIYNYYKKFAEIYMICQIICIRFRNA